MKRPSLAGNMKALQEDTRPNVVALAAPKEPAKRPSPAKREVKTERAPAERYAGMKKMLIPLDPVIHQEMRIIGLRDGDTLEKAVQTACAEYVARRKEK